MAELAKVDLANVIREECNPPMLEGDMSYHDITEQICSISEWKSTPKAWWVMISITGTMLMLLGGCLAYLVARGIGVWGNNSPAAGPGTLPISSGGSVSDTPVRSSPQFCFCCGRNGERPLIARLKR